MLSKAAGASLPAFVGREAEIQELRQAWRRAFGGRRQVVLLAGEPGIGKTTLVERLAREVVADGGRVLWGTCPPDPAHPLRPGGRGPGRERHRRPRPTSWPATACWPTSPPACGPARRTCPPLPEDRRELFHAAAGLIAELAARNARPAGGRRPPPGPPHDRPPPPVRARRHPRTSRCWSWAPTATRRSTGPTRCRRSSPTWPPTATSPTPCSTACPARRSTASCPRPPWSTPSGYGPRATPSS